MKRTSLMSWAIGGLVLSSLVGCTSKDPSSDEKLDQTQSSGADDDSSEGDDSVAPGSAGNHASDDDSSEGDDTAEDSTTDDATADDNPSDAADCRGPGHYEAGKEGSYLPCCAGFTEVFQKYPAYDGDDQPICTDPPLRVYACVEGECGDGVCEVGEDVACGCVEDCQGAVWEAEATRPSGGSEQPAVVDAGAPSSVDAGERDTTCVRSTEVGRVACELSEDAEEEVPSGERAWTCTCSRSCADSDSASGGSKTAVSCTQAMDRFCGVDGPSCN